MMEGEAPSIAAPGSTAMHITAVCPGCGTSYQLSPTMRGQSMRCPLPTCRTVFTVGTISAGGVVTARAEGVFIRVEQPIPSDTGDGA